jgi:hypothetical protein
MAFVDPGCDFIDGETNERCGRTPSRPLHLVMSAPDPTEPGHRVDMQYARLCEEHLPEMQHRLGSN